MSASRRLRRLAARSTFEQLSAAPENAKHGCTICRGVSWRHELGKNLIAKGVLGASICKCADCGGEWLVRLYATAEDMLCISFARPTGKSALN